MLIDESATRLLARHQPVAGDLRFITAALKINKDLERMGDLAVNIAERALSYISRGFDIGIGDISEMTQAAQSMMRQSLDAFVGWDQTLARKVIAADDFVDDLKHAVYRRLICGIDAGQIPPAPGFDIIFVAHNLERIADHAANISEDVLFMITGSDVRHSQ
jgi:phosphate transport system protein